MAEWRFGRWEGRLKDVVGTIWFGKQRQSDCRFCSGTEDSDGVEAWRRGRRNLEWRNKIRRVPRGFPACQSASHAASSRTRWSASLSSRQSLGRRAMPRASAASRCYSAPSTLPSLPAKKYSNKKFESCCRRMAASRSEQIRLQEENALLRRKFDAPTPRIFGWSSDTLIQESVGIPYSRNSDRGPRWEKDRAQRCLRLNLRRGRRPTSAGCECLRAHLSSSMCSRCRWKLKAIVNRKGYNILIVSVQRNARSPADITIVKSQVNRVA